MDLNTIYMICAIAGGTVLVLRLILMLLGSNIGGGDAAVDLDLDGAVDSPEPDAGVALLSLQSIAGFFTMFGLVGMGLLQVKVSPIWSLVGALAAGGFTAWVTALIFYHLRRLQSEGTMVIQNAVGQTGTVYLTIPETGTGVVTVAVKGALRSLDAISKNGQRIPTGSIVKVVDITAGKILVVVEDSKDHP